MNYISFDDYSKENVNLAIEHYGCSEGRGYGDFSIVKIIPDKRWMMIDSGSKTNSDKSFFKTYFNVLPKDNENGFVLYTHWHNDHYGGSIQNLNFKLCYGLKSDAVTKTRKGVINAVNGIVDIDDKDVFINKDLEMFNKNNLKITIATPNLTENHYNDENHLSLMPIIEYGDFKYLGLADITKETFPAKLLGKKYKVIRLPHHGSYGNIMRNIKLKNYIFKEKPHCIISGLGGDYVTSTIQELINNKVEVTVLTGDEGRKASVIKSYQKKWYNTGLFTLSTYIRLEIDSNGNCNVVRDKKLALPSYYGGLKDF
ncbi:MAG: hypothetical protein KAX49_07000 [Halanaerobiales bacterium]|nr:hypothetical protein [Halanaerobiales bacterium]